MVTSSLSCALPTLMLVLIGSKTEALIPPGKGINSRSRLSSGPTTTTSATALYASSSSSDNDVDSNDPIQMARLRLEMHWGLEEAAEDCIIEDPTTCGSEVCPECQGSGRCVCRFCRGTKALYQQGNFQKCPVCNSEGHEVCHSCAGTGYIAEWTKPNNNPTELRP